MKFTNRFLYMSTIILLLLFIVLQYFHTNKLIRNHIELWNKDFVESIINNDIDTLTRTSQFLMTYDLDRLEIYRHDTKIFSLPKFPENDDCRLKQDISIYAYNQQFGHISFCPSPIKTIITVVTKHESLLLLSMLILLNVFNVVFPTYFFNKKFIAFMEDLRRQYLGIYKTQPIQKTQLDSVSLEVIKIMDEMYAEQLKYKLENEKNAAMAQTTLMLAHDVRKPFSMIQSLLNILDKSHDIGTVKDLIRQFNPEISLALKSVNGMIADVMEVGSQSTFETESISSRSLIDQVMRECFVYHEQAALFFQYDFQHQHMMQVNSLKIKRVFSNIIMNAAEAMNFRGQIWLKTRQLTIGAKSFVEICIGNEGSNIPEEDIEHLFEAFYTKNKKGGTGLGLAIAKKIITSHGGEIACRCLDGVGVEFVFTLPSNDMNDEVNVQLPRQSQDILQQLPVLGNRSHQLQEQLIFVHLENKIMMQLNGGLVQLLDVFVVDDESIYRQLVVNYLHENDNFKKHIRLNLRHDISNLENDILQVNPQLVLLDIDLNAEKNGFEIARTLKGLKFKGKICIHSNRDPFEFQEEFKNSGADLMLPKPIAREQLLKMIDSIVQELNVMKRDGLDFKVKKIIVLDDSHLALTAWKLHAKDIQLYTYKSPEALYQEMETKKELLQEIDCIITDFDFSSENSKYTGLEFAQQLRSSDFKKPIYLYSGYEFKESEWNQIVDLLLPKDVKEAWRIVKGRLG